MADIKSLIDKFNIFRTKDSILNDVAKDNGQITIDIQQPFSDDIDSNNSLKTKLETNIKDKLFNTEINSVGSKIFDEKIKPFDKGYNVSNTPDTDTKTPIDTTPIKPDTPTIEKNTADATAIQQEKTQQPEITTQEPEPEATQQYKTIIIQKKPKLTTDSLGNYMPIDYDERKGTSYSGVGEQQIDELYNILKDDEKKFDMFMGLVYEALDQLKYKPLNDTENIIFLPFSFDHENGNMNGARLRFGLGQKEWAEKQLKTLATKLTDKQNEEWLSNLKLPEPETTMDKITSNPWGKLLSFIQPPETPGMDPVNKSMMEEGQHKNRLNAIKWRLIDKINECKKVFDKYYGDKSQVGTALSEGNIAETVYNILLPKMKLAEDAEIALILKKSKENPKGLTPIEKEIVNYSKMLFRALSVIDSKTTTGYKTTKSILNSLPFMADFFRANLIGSATRGGTRTAMKLLGKNAAKEFEADVSKNIVSRAGKFAGDIGKAAVHTPLSTLTHQNMLEDYSQTIATNGQYTKNDLIRGGIEAFTENFSERMFGALKGILPKSNNVFVNSLFGNNPVIKSMQKHMNVGGMFEETAEEYAGDFLNTMFGFMLNDEKLAKSFKEGLDNSATTILSIGITVGLPQIFGMGIDFRQIKKLNNRFNVAENNLKQYFNKENSYLDINRYSDGLKSLYINLNNAKNEEDKAEIKGKIADLNKTAANLAMEKGDSNGFNLISEYSIAAQNSFYVTNKAMSELKDMSEEDRTKLVDNAINKLKNDFTNNLNWSLISRAAAKNITDQNGKQHPTCFLYTDNGVTYVLNGQKDNMFSFVDVNGNTISKSADELRNNENLSVLHLNNLLSSFSNKELEDINSKFIDIAQYNAGYRYKVNDNGEIKYYTDNKELIKSNTPYEEINRDKIESNLVGSYDLVRIDNITNAVEDMAKAFAETDAEQTSTEQQTSEQQPAQQPVQETIEQTAEQPQEQPAQEPIQEPIQEQPIQEQTTEEQETTEQEPIQQPQQEIEPTQQETIQEQIEQIQQEQPAQEEDVKTNNADKKHNDWYVTEEVTIKDGIKKTKYSKWRKSKSGEFKRVALSGKPISLEEAQDIFDLEDIYLDDVRNLEIIEIREGENGAWATIKVTYNFNQTVNFDVKVKKKRNDDSTALNEQENTESQGKKPNIPQTEEAALRDALIDKVREAGIDVITDVEEAQRVLDEANGNDIRQQKTTLDAVIEARDKEYLEAVRNGDLDKAQRMVVEAAKLKGYNSGSQYQGTSAFNGAAPWGNGYFLTKEERKEAWDNDEYDGDQTLGDYIHRGIDMMNLDLIALDPRHYRAADPMRKEAIDNVRNAIQKKSETITMYRSVPSDVKEGSFRNGDWVTPSRAYAVENAKVHGWGDNFNIIEQKVPVDEIWWDGNDIAEWGYGREEDFINDKDFAYKNTKNNRKLLDAVTYDDNGNVIPLSKRFNARKSDIRFFRTADGNAYGFTVGGKIYIDQRIATADTPIHEYAHLWASAMQKLNPNEWENIVKLMKGTPIWEEVKRNYPELTNDNEIADEVLAFYSGSRGAERLREEHAKILKGNGNVVEKVKAINAIKRVREALKRFWKNVAEWFGIHFTTAEEVADKVLSDLLNGVNPTLAGVENDIRFEENSEEAEIVARAKADGTYMKAPNGKQSNLSPRQWVQVRTKAFKDWFGDWENDPDNSSKVVDENGEPMVVYHGSGDTFTIFSPQSEWHGNFFSSERSVAESYSPTADNVIFEERKRPFVDVKFKDGRIERQYYDLGGIYNVYLDINKPLVVDCKGKNWNDIHFKGIKTTTDHISDYALKQGYDGVIFINLIDGAYRGLESSNSFVAFNSNQIKSATDNIGTFDQNNPDIRYQFVGEKGAAAMDKAEEATIRLDNLAVARDMEKAGKDAKDIKLATGWERGAEGKWRYEILDGRFDASGELHSERRRLTDEEQKELDDAFFETIEAFSKGNEAYTKEITEDTDMADIYEAGGMERSKAERISFLEKKKSELSKKPKTLDDYIDNEELFAAYPELRDLVVEVGNRNAALIGNFGAYLPKKNTIRLNDISLSTLSHEVQHAIQYIEGFAKGGSKSNVRNTIKKNIKASKELSDKIKGKSNMELYRAIMGEVEARNVQSRLGMSEEERRRSLAIETEDVERKDQIFLEDGLGVSASEVDKKTNAANRRASNRSVISSRFERQAEIQREEKNTKSAANIVLGNANVVLNDTNIFDEQYQNAIDNNLIDENVSPLIDSFGITWGYQLKNGVIVINKDVFISDILDKRVKDNLSLLISSLMKTNKTFFKEGISFFKKLPIWVLYKNDTKSNEDTIKEIINDILLGNTSIDTNKLELLKQYTVQDMNDILDNATKWFEKFEGISSNMFAGNSISDILDTTLGNLMPKEITTTQEGKRLNWFSKLGIDIRSKLFDSLDWFRVVSDKTKDKTASELYDAMIVHTKRVQGRIDVFDKEYVRPIIDTIQSMLGKDFGNSTLSLDLIQEYFAIKSLLGRTASLYKEKFEAYLTNAESKKPPMFDEFKQIYDEITEDEIRQRINEMGEKSSMSILQKVDIDYLMEEVRRTLAAEMFVKQYVYSSANTLNQGLQGEQSLGLINEVTNEPYSELYQLLYSGEQSSQTMHSPTEIIEQADILIDRAGLREQFDFIGNQIQAILNYVNIERVENGLMSSDTFAKRQLMKDFVNQRGENSSEGNLYEITAKQKANEKMKGKDWFNPNSITSIIAVAQTEIATMEKELLAQRLSYFLTNPNNFDVLSQYGMIIDEKETLNEELSEDDRNYIMDKNIVLLYGDRHTDKNTTGQVDKKKINILKRNDDGTFTKVTISFDNKFIGLEEFVKFVNNNFKYEDLRGISKAAAPFTAWFSRMYTILSPLFPTKNLFKDLMVTPWLPAKELNGKNSQYAIKNFYNAFNNLSFILKMSFTEKSFSKKGFENKLKARSQELFEYYLEYSKQHSIFNIEDQIGALSKENKTLQDIERALSSKENKFIKFTERALLIKFMQHYAEVFENLHKFSAYVTLRKLGYGEERSAQIANNATLNYDRSGSIGRQLNAIIPFAKAALGGLYRTNYLLPKYNPKGFLQRVITLAVLGVMQGLMYDPDDDDISEFARKSGMVFGSFLYPLLPEELAIVRPVRALVIVMAGKKSPAYFKQELMESTIDLVPVASDALRGAFSYNPLTNKPEFDAGQLFANTDKMTAFYALAMLASYINENKNSFGKNVLLNEETNTDKTRYGRTKQDYGLYDYIARLYNSIINGVDIDDRAAMSNKIGKNGERLMTIAKEDVEFVINNYIPFGRLYAYTAEIIYDAVNDKRINKGHIPLIGGLFAQKSFGKNYYLVNNIKYELKDFINDFSQSQIEDIKTNILDKAGIREGIIYKAIKDDNNVNKRRKDKAKQNMNEAFNLFILDENNVDKKDFTEDEQKVMLYSFLNSSIMKKALSIGEDTLNKHTAKRIDRTYDRYKKHNNENYDADKENPNDAVKKFKKELYDNSITEEELNNKLNSLWEPMFQGIILRAKLAGFSINL